MEDENSLQNLEERKYKGELVQFQKINEEEYRIARILSTNPTAFLRKDLEPGRIVKMKFNK